MANKKRKQTKRAAFSFVLQLCTFTTYYFLFWMIQNEQTYSRSIEIIREYFGRVESAFKALCTFWTRRQNMLLYFNIIFNASCTFSKRLT